MFNCVSIIGSLLDGDKDEPRIRYILVERVYSNLKANVITDKIPIMNWNKEPRGEIFSFPKNAMVALRGRIESYNDKTVIVCETITNLGLKY